MDIVPLHLKTSLKNCGINLDKWENSPANRPALCSQVFIGVANIELRRNEETTWRCAILKANAVLSLSDDYSACPCTLCNRCFRAHNDLLSDLRKNSRSDG